MSEEVWKPVLGFEGQYEVSNLGRVKSLDRIDAGGRNWKGRIMKPWDTRGYGSVTFGKRTKRRVNRLVCEAFNGPAPKDKPHALHRNGNPKDNRPENLYWGDDADNTADKMKHGTHPQKTKTHCKWGHEFTPENTYTNPGREGRGCRTCRKTKKGLEPGDSRHGTLNGYTNRGCRCTLCSEGASRASKNRRATNDR